MRGLKTSDLNLIVDFLYHGEVNVPREKLDDFLALAGELQLKGLSGDSSERPPSSDFQGFGETGDGLVNADQPKKENRSMLR